MTINRYLLDSKKNILMPEYSSLPTHDIKNKKNFKGISSPVFAKNDYLSQLNKIVLEVRKDVDAILLPKLKKNESRYTKDSWVDDIINAFKRIKNKYTNSALNTYYEKVSEKFVNSVNKYNKRRSDASFGINALNDSNTNDFIRISVFNNVNLIKSIPLDLLNEVEDAVLREINIGSSYKSLQDFIYKRFDVTKSRAKLIAVDQTAKINGQLTIKRQENAGFKFFKWQTVEDERVRSSHQHLADRVTKYGRGIYLLTAPPKGLKGKRIIPAFEYRCRCISIPVLFEDVENGRYL